MNFFNGFLKISHEFLTQENVIYAVNVDKRCNMVAVVKCLTNKTTTISNSKLNSVWKFVTKKRFFFNFHFLFRLTFSFFTYFDDYFFLISILLLPQKVHHHMVQIVLLFFFSLCWCWYLNCCCCLFVYLFICFFFFHIRPANYNKCSWF